MDDSKNFRFSLQVIIVPFIAVFSIWLVYWSEIRFGYNFTKYGILPKTVTGLKGVLYSPFIHSSTSHLINNSIPLAVLLWSLFFFYKELAFKTLVFGLLLTGLLTWSFARESYHIGASGVVYMLFSFVFFSGLIRKHYRLVALSLAVVFLYGGMIWYVFPIKSGMSWEGHLSGFIVGLLLAILYRNKGPQKKEFVFTQTKFDLMFDENGNYNPEALIEKETEEQL
ncbi:rhomboid family intramembrane serine protease [Urechidicola vernalis]|uniref:Rhomboid family intramembrane serine protease n=1 Tax=Urechidicola vernalis TaxID=3075600 RepID=A0ABU2Y304_9FLAO|nr:rhomboid family intramembrane serine protease [Urechidicola sp. P050]MDT0552589.1 rhomboid family intramembrane serine protease [Urechidicola sp. P050]